MNSSQIHIVNLDLPASQRWLFLRSFDSEIKELLTCYLNDLRDAMPLLSSIDIYKNQIIPLEYLEEINCIAEISGFSSNEVLIANLYYDLLKFYLGCTAFAVNTGDFLLHARNLDWHTDQNLLAKHSRIFDFQRKNKTIFRTVGWYGFIGAFSGCKPGRFALTLNAVSSYDKPEIAKPVTFLLRDILSSANDFTQARGLLETTDIASDCLILISGTHDDEMAVIERTPRRYSTRYARGRHMIVTNDYRQLENRSDNTLLQSTSCSRYDRACQLLAERLPENAEDCMQILKDDKVMMGITVQQMVFNPTTGDILLHFRNE